MPSDHQVHDNGFTLSGSSRMYFSSQPTDGFEADAYWQVSRPRCSKVNDVLVSGYFWHFVHIHIHIRLNIALIPKLSLEVRQFPIQPFDQGRLRKYYSGSTMQCWVSLGHEKRGSIIRILFLLSHYPFCHLTSVGSKNIIGPSLCY